jgi:putative transposase
MPVPMSMDLRLRIVRAVERGSSIRAAARRFVVSPSAAIKLMQRVRATGSAAPARYGGHRRPVLGPHEADLKGLVAATPDITLAELQSELQRRCGVRAGLSTIHNALRRIGLRHKKSP